jgi:hypothetical protein
MQFYQITSPSTKQIFDAIISRQYVPIEKIAPKAKQIRTLLLDHFCASEILVTFSGVTNTGGVPIFLTSNDCLYEIASEEAGFYELSEDDQNNEIELLGCYLRTYNDIFNL